VDRATDAWRARSFWLDMPNNLPVFMWLYLIIINKQDRQSESRSLRCYLDHYRNELRHSVDMTPKNWTTVSQGWNF
jgi:hypothetical protein